MKHLTEHLWFETPHRRDYLNIMDTIEKLVRMSGVPEGLCLVNAKHITSGICSCRQRNTTQRFQYSILLSRC